MLVACYRKRGRGAQSVVRLWVASSRHPVARSQTAWFIGQGAKVLLPLQRQQKVAGLLPTGALDLVAAALVAEVNLVVVRPN